MLLLYRSRTAFRTSYNKKGTLLGRTPKSESTFFGMDEQQQAHGIGDVYTSLIVEERKTLIQK